MVWEWKHLNFILRPIRTYIIEFPEIYKQNVLSGIIHCFRIYQRNKVKISVLDFWVCLDSQKNI